MLETNIKSNSTSEEESGYDSNPYASSPTIPFGKKRASDFPAETTASMAICIFFGAIWTLLVLAAHLLFPSLEQSIEKRAFALNFFYGLIAALPGLVTMCAGVLMLMRLRYGIYVGAFQILCFVVVLANLVFGIGQVIASQFRNDPNAGSEQLVRIVGLLLISVIPICIELMFVLGFLRFCKWASKEGV